MGEILIPDIGDVKMRGTQRSHRVGETGGDYKNRKVRGHGEISILKSRAEAMLALFQREYKSRESLLKLHKAPVRPHLENCEQF